MYDDGRFIPPGPGRRAAFAQKGGFPKSPLLFAGVGISVACAVFFFLKASLMVGLMEAFRGGIENAAITDRPLGEAACGAGISVLNWAGPVVFSGVVGLIAVWILSIAILKKGKGSTVSPLPEMPSARLPIAAIRLFAALVFVVCALLAVRSTAVDGASTSFSAWIGGIWTLCFRVFAALGLILVTAGAAEVLVLRHQIYRSLFLNRSEARRELRAETGNYAPRKRAREQFPRKADADRPGKVGA